MQFEEPGDDAKMDEDCKKEVDKEANRRKKLQMRKKDITKETRKLDGIKIMDEASQKVPKDNRQKELAQIDQR